MDNNKGKFIVGSVQDFARGKGWFFGHFMDKKLLKSNLVDVSWQHYPACAGRPYRTNLLGLVLG